MRGAGHTPLTEAGETLLSVAGDATPLRGTYVGVHVACEGFVDMHDVSATNAALVCRKCCLRVYLPRGVTTHGGLRNHFANRMRTMGFKIPE